MQYRCPRGVFCLLLYMQIKYKIFSIQFRVHGLISIRNQSIVIINTCSLIQCWASRCHLHLTTYEQRPHSQPDPSWDADQSIPGETEMCSQRLFWCHRCSLITWWGHQMETFSALLALCEGNSPVTGEFPSKRPVTRSFGVFIDLRLNKRLSKQSRSRYLRRHPAHYDVTVMIIDLIITFLE